MQTQKAIESNPGVWRFDPAYTTVEFTVRKLFLFTVSGRFKSVDGSITLDEDDLSRSSVQATIKANSIDTGNSKRDSQLRGKEFLDVDNFPDVKFESVKVGPGQDRDSVDVSGKLTIKGKSQTVPLAVSAIDRSRSPSGDEFVYYSATAELNRLNFGVNGAKLFVGHSLKVTINVQASRRA